MKSDRAEIRKLPTGIAGFDEVLGGGLTELSFNLIAGGPGCGKTTMAHQIMFANATMERPSVYFTVLGEPPFKMLRYQQQFTFFDNEKVSSCVHFVDLSKDLVEGGLGKVLERILQEVEAIKPGLVFVDSFRAIVRETRSSNVEGDLALERFVQTLALRLTSCEATTFLIGEYPEAEVNSDPLFTVADGVCWLHQSAIRNSVVRRLQVVKVRGQKEIPGFHTFRISDDGVRVFPRLPNPEEPAPGADVPQRLAKSTGIAGLDDMLGGGIPAGYSIMLAGPSGSGKTVLSTQFILEGLAHDEPGVIVVFEKRPKDYLRTSPRGRELGELTRAGKIKLVYIRPLDLSVDETLEQVRLAVRSIGAKRVVVDSLSGFELALAPAFRDDFRESLYRMVGALTGMGVTVVLTVEISDSFTELRLSPHGISFLTDGIILQRYTERAGALQKVMAVVKLRARNHSKGFHAYEITGDGIVVGTTLAGYTGILTGHLIPLNPRVTDRVEPERGNE